MAQYDIILPQNIADSGKEFVEREVAPEKGGLVTFDASKTPIILSPGSNGKVLSADNTEISGLKWVDLSSGDLLKAEVVLTPQNLMNNELVQIVAPTGENTLVVPMSAIGIFFYGTTPYSGNDPHIHIIYSNNILLLRASAVSISGQTENRIFTFAQYEHGGSTYNAVNNGLYVKVYYSTLTGGNGTAKIVVYYKVLSIL